MAGVQCRNFMGVPPACWPKNRTLPSDPSSLQQPDRTHVPSGSAAVDACGPEPQPANADGLSASAMTIDNPAAAATSSACTSFDAAPCPTHRTLPLQTLEAVYAHLPHYASPADIPGTGAQPAAPALPGAAGAAAEHSYASGITRRAAGVQSTAEAGNNAASWRALGARLAARSSDPHVLGAGSLGGTPAAAAVAQAQQSAASAFQVLGAGQRPPPPQGAEAGWARRRYSAPHNLVLHLKRAYLDEPSVVKGRIRYDRYAHSFLTCCTKCGLRMSALRSGTSETKLWSATICSTLRHESNKPVKHANSISQKSALPSS